MCEFSSPVPLLGYHAFCLFWTRGHEASWLWGAGRPPHLCSRSRFDGSVFSGLRLMRDPGLELGPALLGGRLPWGWGKACRGGRYGWGSQLPATPLTMVGLCSERRLGFLTLQLCVVELYLCFLCLWLALSVLETHSWQQFAIMNLAWYGSDLHTRGKGHLARRQQSYTCAARKLNRNKR